MSGSDREGPDTITTTCCVVGGGPAGMMLGLLLARAGVDVTVLEKHADFLRDFRGDTIHPSTLCVMEELGLLDALLKLPHNPVRELQVQISDKTINVANFSFLPKKRAFIAMMPQWHFLNFLAEQGRRYPNFHLHMQANVTSLLEAAVASPACAPRHPRARSRSKPTSSSAAMGATRPCGRGPASRWRTSARPSTSCGCASRAAKRSPVPEGASTAAAFSSCSTAATTGSSPT